MAIKKGDRVKIEYVGKLDDGTVFDSSKMHSKPLEFEVGVGKIIPGLDKAILGMEINEEKEITIQPEEAYGARDPQLIKKLPRDKVSIKGEIKEGMLLMLGLPSGQQIPASIVKVTPNDITIDLNHPLAGKTLHFKIKVLEVN
ncbi:peptidylprolyl isomerase [Candidatus Woesearchaeota archaeon]|nr:MAG: peptidylprolyl isomerase [Candidatus Woesearchaeota archaeon]